LEDRRARLLRTVLLAGDAAILVLSAAAAFALHRLLRPRLPVLRDPPEFGAYAALAWFLLPVWLTLVVLLGLHRSLERDERGADTVARLLGLHALGLVALSVIAFLTQSVVNRSLVALFLACVFPLMLLERRGLAALLRQRHGGEGSPGILVAGGDVTAIAARMREAAAGSLPPRFVGWLAPEGAVAAGSAAGLPVHVGGLEALPGLIEREAIDQVFFFSPWDRPESVPEALAALELSGIPAHFAVRRIESLAAVPRVSEQFGAPFISYEVAPKAPEALAVKHALDLLVAALLAAVLSPLMLLVALAILVRMGQPVLFAQERAGLNGRRFRMLKFRTMVRGAEERRDDFLGRNEMDGPVFKLADDPRVTPLGRMLRRLSLDELPQLLNVVAGDMSLVGPRPLPVREQTEIRGASRRRLSMKPGITGLWQVSGRNDLGFEDWMRLDLLYVDTWSLGLDLRILLRTLPAVLLSRGAR
jgi:exopolysaccharide biosynthesis polyprenyl glycosylphosphotransferase